MCIGLQSLEDSSSLSLGGLFAFEPFFVVVAMYRQDHRDFCSLSLYERKIYRIRASQPISCNFEKNSTDVRQPHASNIRQPDIVINYSPYASSNWLKVTLKKVSYPHEVHAWKRIEYTFTPEHVQTKATFSTELRSDSQYRREQTFCQSVCKSKVLQMQPSDEA